MTVEPLGLFLGLALEVVEFVVGAEQDRWPVGAVSLRCERRVALHEPAQAREGRGHGDG
jgi:hypothetical protein